MMPSSAGPLSVPPILHFMVCCGSYRNRQPLHGAVQSGRIRATAILVAVVPAAVLGRDSDGVTAAHICVKLPMFDVVLHLLLDACPAVAAVKDNTGEYPLHAAYNSALHGGEQEAALRRLFEAYPEALRLTTNSFGWTPLHRASTGSYPVALRLFLSWWPDGAKSPDRWGDTPIQVAIQHRCFDAVRTLVTACPESLWIANPNRCNTPLHDVAAQYLCNLDIEAYLLRIIDPGLLMLKNALGETPLHVAVAGGRTEMVRQWTTVNPKAVHERVTWTGDTVFHLAVRQSHHETFQLLFELWPDGLSQTNQAGMLPLDLTPKNGPYDGFTILHVAAKKNDVNMITTFLSAFPDRMTMSMTTKGHTVLEIAMKHDAYDVIDCLRLKPECWSYQQPHGWPHQQRDGNTALHNFVMFGKPKQVIALLKGMKDARPLELIQLRGEDGDTLAHTAAAQGRKREILKTLLQLWPEAAVVENNDHLTPFDVARDFFDLRVLFQFGSTRRCPVSSDSGRASRTVQRREKIDAVSVLVDQTSRAEDRRAAVEVLRAPWQPSERDFSISKRMCRKLFYRHRSTSTVSLGAPEHKTTS